MLKVLAEKAKTCTPIEGAFPKKYAVVKALQNRNAKSPMLVTLFPMVTLVKLVQD
jgi:hypothetical protein